jgi:hypothetical protein
VVVGKDRDLVAHMLMVLSYFIRCNEVVEADPPEDDADLQIPSATSQPPVAASAGASGVASDPLAGAAGATHRAATPPTSPSTRLSGGGGGSGGSGIGGDAGSCGKPRPTSSSLPTTPTKYPPLTNAYRSLGHGAPATAATVSTAVTPDFKLVFSQQNTKVAPPAEARMAGGQHALW